MKRCPECGRDYNDDSLSFCLDDGAELLFGPKSFGEPQTAILHDTDAPGEALTRAQIHTPAVEPQSHVGEPSPKQNFSTNIAAKPLLIAVGLAVVVLVGFLGYRYFNSSSEQIESIAVMPFVNSSGNSDIEYLSDGMTETLINSLSKVPNLSVKARSSVFRYKGKETDAETIGNELGVQAVLNGRVAQYGDQVILTLELVDVSTENVIWSEKYERNASDLVKLQSEIAVDVSGKLRSKLSGSAANVETAYTADSEAYQLYLKGRFHYAKQAKADYEKAIELYSQAIARDPNFARAYVQISISYLSMASWGFAAPKDNVQKAKAAAQRALDIDSNLAEAHGVFAWLASSFEWDWQKAESEYKRAIELDPNIAEIHHLYGFDFLMPMGRTRENIFEQKRALELEPLAIIYGAHLGAAYMYDGQLDKALEQVEATANLDPEHTASVYYRGVIYIANGMYDRAIDLAEKKLGKDPDDQNMLEIGGYAYARAGQRRKAEEVIERFREISKTRYIMTSSIAPIYIALGEKNKAIAELERAYELRDPFILQLNIHPYFEDIRDDPRVVAIAKQIGLPERK